MLRRLGARPAMIDVRALLGNSPTFATSTHPRSRMELGESDSDCGGNYQCVNFGGLGFTVDLRCGSPCATDEDCPAADMACVEDVDSVTGALTGKKVCGPSFCE